MENKIKHLGIIAFMALIVVFMLIVSCGESKISGTFSYYEELDDYFITFKGNIFVGKWGGDDIAGTFSVVDDKIILDMKWDTIVIRIIDKNTLEDPDGDRWRRRK